MGKGRGKGKLTFHRRRNTGTSGAIMIASGAAVLASSRSSGWDGTSGS